MTSSLRLSRYEWRLGRDNLQYRSSNLMIFLSLLWPRLKIRHEQAMRLFSRIVLAMRRVTGRWRHTLLTNSNTFVETAT